MVAVSSQPTSLRIPDDLKARVKTLAEAREQKETVIYLRAIEDYVEREEKREAFRQEGIKAWEEYQLTGLHVTGVEADAWLKELEEGNNVEPPACHI